MVCVNKSQQLRELVIRLVEKENSVLPGNYYERIDEILDSNDLALDERIPDWIVSFFANIIDEKQVEKNKFIYKEKGQGDVCNFLAELDDILEMKCDDYGEDVTMFFEKSKMIGYITFESFFWSTLRNGRKEFIDKCKGGDERMVERYIEYYCFDINTRDLTGKTLLHHAVINKNRDFARFLLNYGIDPAICDWKGKKALDYAEAQEGKNVSVYAKADMDDMRRILTEKPDLYPEVAEIVWLLRNGSSEEEMMQAVMLLSEDRDLRRALDRRELSRLKKSTHPDVQALIELIGKDKFTPDRFNSCTRCGRYTLKYIRKLTRGAAAPTPEMEIEFLNECLSCGARVITWN